MKKPSIKQQLLLFLFTFLVFLSFRDKDGIVFIKAIAAFFTSALIDSLFYTAENRRLKVTESSLITGLIIGFILSPSAQWWLFSLAAIIAIASKHIVRIGGRHIFNPAAFGVVSVLFLFHESTRWHGAYCWYIIIPFGIYFAFSIKRLTTVMIYYSSSLLLYGIYAYVQKRSVIDEIIYLNHFFVLVMLIEPKTSPLAKIEKIIFGLSASILCFILYAVHFTFSPELPSLLFVNSGYFIFKTIRRRYDEK